MEMVIDHLKLFSVGYWGADWMVMVGLYHALVSFFNRQ
jgi:hypothetical protein